MLPLLPGFPFIAAVRSVARPIQAQADHTPHHATVADAPPDQQTQTAPQFPAKIINTPNN